MTKRKMLIHSKCRIRITAVRLFNDAVQLVVGDQEYGVPWQLAVIKKSTGTALAQENNRA